MMLQTSASELFAGGRNSRAAAECHSGILQQRQAAKATSAIRCVAFPALLGTAAISTATTRSS